MKTPESGSAMCEHCGEIRRIGESMRDHKFKECRPAMKEMEKLIYVRKKGPGVHLYRTTSTVVPEFKEQAEKYRIGASKR